MSNAAITSNAAETRCLRCGRRIKSVRALSAGYGRGCAAIIRREAREHALDGLNEKQREKALQLVADKAIVPTNHPGVFRAVASDGTTSYLVTAGGNCSCPWGQRRSSALTKPCAHVGGARLVQITRKSMTKAA